MNYLDILCGLECEVPHFSDIWRILEFPEISLDGFYFHVEDQSVYSADCRIKFPPKVSPDFFRTIDHEDVFVERLVLHLYLAETVPEDIDTYDRYVKSKCQMIVLICDVCYIEIYCKDLEWLHAIADSAKEISGIRIEKKHEGSDARTVMYV